MFLCLLKVGLLDISASGECDLSIDLNFWKVLADIWPRVSGDFPSGTFLVL